MSSEQQKPKVSFEDLGRKVDQESERLIAYLNDEVVPAVRTHSTKALRTAAQKLQQFADYMDDREKAAQEKR
jgi:hypothetical protein